MRRVVNSHGNNLVRSVCLSAVIGAAPLLETSLASAQPVPVATVPVGVRVNSPRNSEITLNNSNGNPVHVYAYSREVAQQVVVDGPSTLTLRVYPSISVNRTRPTRAYVFSYTVDGTSAEVNDLSTTANSGFSNPTIPRGSEIGSPTEVRIITTTSGRHTIIPLGPTGFFEVVSATAPAPAPVAMPQPTITTQTPILTGPTSGVVGNTLTFNVGSCSNCIVRVQDPANVSNDLTPDGSNNVLIRPTTAGRYTLSILRDGTSVGVPLVANVTSSVESHSDFGLHSPRFIAEVRSDFILTHGSTPLTVVSSLDAQYRGRLNPKVSWSIGLYGGFDMTGLNTSTQPTSINLPWGSVIGGVSYDFNSANRLTVLGFAGYVRGIFNSSGRTMSEGEPFGGGRLLYEGRYVEAMLEASSDSLNLARAEVGYRIPRSLVHDVYPVVSLGALLLRNPVSPSPHVVSLSGSDLYSFVYATTNVPLTRMFSLGADLGLAIPTIAPGFGARFMFTY